MATDTNLLMGEVIDNPEGEEKNVEQLLSGFLQALIEEQRITYFHPDPSLKATEENS